MFDPQASNYIHYDSSSFIRPDQGMFPFFSLMPLMGVAQIFSMHATLFLERI